MRDKKMKMDIFLSPIFLSESGPGLRGRAVPRPFLPNVWSCGTLRARDRPLAAPMVLAV